jgi:hypothetical protein
VQTIEQMPFPRWLMEHAEDYGAKVELISSGAPEAVQFLKGLEGVGGVLRFKFAAHEHEDEEEETSASSSGSADDKDETTAADREGREVASALSAEDADDDDALFV